MNIENESFEETVKQYGDVLTRLAESERKDKTERKRIERMVRNFLSNQGGLSQKEQTMLLWGDEEGKGVYITWDKLPEALKLLSPKCQSCSKKTYVTGLDAEGNYVKIPYCHVWSGAIPNYPDWYCAAYVLENHSE